jgi:hypothetical protein
MIKPLSKDDLSKLSLEELAFRMDSIIQTSEKEKYNKIHYFEPYPSVKKIITSIHVNKMSKNEKRNICHLTFNCILQMKYTEFTSTAANHYIYGLGYDEEKSWLYPTMHIRNAALKQFNIISSRIEMECFMQLIHFLGTGKRIKSKKSTFKSFKKWLFDVENPFSYFAMHILKAFIFDRSHRTPEVHASSKLSKAILYMQKPTSEDQNESLELTNIMLNIWNPLLEILNKGKTYSITGNEKDFEWLKSYLNDDKKIRTENLEEIYKQMQ